jgi:hypothetical protein
MKSAVACAAANIETLSIKIVVHVERELAARSVSVEPQSSQTVRCVILVQ